MGSGQWAVDSGQWTVDSGQWTVGRWQWAVGSGPLALGTGQWAVASGQWTIALRTLAMTASSPLSPPTPPHMDLTTNKWVRYAPVVTNAARP